MPRSDRRPVSSPRGDGGGCCLVIGVGPKLGLSVARKFGLEGYPVGLVSRHRGPLEEIRDALVRSGITAEAFPADMSAEGAAEEVVGLAGAGLGPIEVLIYNAAALGVRAPPSEVELDLFYSTLRTNVVSALLATQKAVADMRRLGRGTVIFTGGTWGLVPSADYCLLGLGKAALRSLAQSFAEELRPEGIHVVSYMISGVIAPGTEFDPDALAARYWDVHRQPRSCWEHDIVD